MITYVCICGDSLAVIDNTEQSRKQKRAWKEKHNARMVQKSPKRKIAGSVSATGHKWVRRVSRKAR